MNHSLISQFIYLAKVILGLLVLAGLMVVANGLGIYGLSLPGQKIVLGVLVAVALSIVPIAKRIYNGMDELRKIMHQHACVASLSLVVAIYAVVGILQATQLLPLFNQFWALGITVGIWGFQLMLADRRHR